MSGKQSVITEPTAASTPEVFVAPDDAAVVPVDVPHVPSGNVYSVRAEEGRRNTVITRYDLERADVSGGPVLPTWSDPKLVIATYGLGHLVQSCEALAGRMFGPTVSLRIDVEYDPDACAPSLVLRLNVPRTARPLRHQFLTEYARQVVIPEGAPVPVLLWEYHDAVPT